MQYLGATDTEKYSFLTLKCNSVGFVCFTCDPMAFVGRQSSSPGFLEGVRFAGDGCLYFRSSLAARALASSHGICLFISLEHITLEQGTERLRVRVLPWEDVLWLVYWKQCFQGASSFRLGRNSKHRGCHVAAGTRLWPGTLCAAPKSRETRDGMAEAFSTSLAPIAAAL